MKINKNTSFTSFVKNEIQNYKWNNKELDILLLSILKATYKYDKDNNLVFSTSLLGYEKTFVDFFYKKLKLKTSPLKTKTLIKFVFKDEVEIKNILSLINKQLNLDSLPDLKSYVTGLFLAKGWINSPKSKFYHCEIRLKRISDSLDVQNVLTNLNINSLTLEKNKWFYTYIKKSTDITNFLTLLNASQSVMIFEDSRIERDFISTLKKMESIEEYNYKKTIEASTRQIKVLKEILNSKKVEFLSKEKINLVNLRIDNPTYSLSELQMEYYQLYGKNLSKSTISLWLKKIMEI